MAMPTKLYGTEYALDAVIHLDRVHLARPPAPRPGHNIRALGSCMYVELYDVLKTKLGRLLYSSNYIRGGSRPSSEASRIRSCKIEILHDFIRTVGYVQVTLIKQSKSACSHVNIDT